MKNNIINRTLTLDSHELHKLVSEKIDCILKQANISPCAEIFLEKIRGEDSHSIFRIECGGAAYALKVFSGSTDGNEFYTNKIFNQIAREYGIPTPQMIHSNDDRDVLPAPWIVWEWFSGKPSCDIDSDAKRRESAIKAGVGLRKMHEIKMSGFGHPITENKWPGGDMKWAVDFFVKRIQKLIEKGGTVFLEKELLDIFKVTAESSELLSFTEPRLLHGDITGGNVLVSDSEDITYIDPGEIIAGDPMSDLGYSQTTGLSPIFREGFWKGYTKDEPLTTEEYDRFLRWRILRQCVIACRAVINGDKNAEKYINDVRLFLEELKNNVST